MTQLLGTATRTTIGSANLIDHVFQNHFFDNPDGGVLDADLTDHCASFVKLPLSGKTYDDNETTYKVITFIYYENGRQVYLELLSNERKMPNLYADLDVQLETSLESKQKPLNYALL